LVPAPGHRVKDRPIRALRAILLIAIVVLIAGIAVWQITGFGLGHWLQIHLGITNEAGPYYGFFSGSGSDLGEIAILGGIGTLLAGLWHKFNCHNEGCMRIGLHPLAGGAYVVCRKHHAEITGHQHSKLSTEFLATVHREHLERITACPPGSHDG
jgi:hypothetical protein